MFKSSESKICLGLIALAAGIFIASLRLPQVNIWSVPGPDSPYQAEAGTWPCLVCAALIALCLLQILLKTLSKKPAAPRQAQGAHRPMRVNSRALAFIAVLVAYMLLLVPLGFPLATLLMGMGTVLVLDTGSFGKGKSLVIVSLISAGIMALFSKLLYLPLPRGLGIFRDFTQWLIF